MSKKIWVKDQDGLGLYLCDNIGTRFDKKDVKDGDFTCHSVKFYSIVTILPSGKEAILWDDEMSYDDKPAYVIEIMNKRQFIIDTIDDEVMSGGDYVSIQAIEEQYEHRNDKLPRNEFKCEYIQKMKENLIP